MRDQRSGDVQNIAGVRRVRQPGTEGHDSVLNPGAGDELEREDVILATRAPNERQLDPALFVGVPDRICLDPPRLTSNGHVSAVEIRE
jgi:hypothetical protein